MVVQIRKMNIKRVEMELFGKAANLKMIIIMLNFIFYQFLKLRFYQIYGSDFE